MIKLCIPGRFEPELLDHLEPLQAETGRIHEVYGSIPRSILGSARPTRRLTEHAGDKTLDDVSRFTARSHETGIEVNYTLNALVTDHTEYTRRGRDKIVRYINDVAETGVDRVTVTVPYLIELVRSELPELPVSVSVINEVDSTHSLRLFEEYGVERIFLAEECNRDFELLELLTGSATADLALLVNNGCLRFCPLRIYHFCIASQGSQQSAQQDSYIDYPLLKCSAKRARSPVEILRSPWIRPEDLAYYEQRFGIDTFKIVGRQLPLEKIVEMAGSYARLAHDGNFIDLLSTPVASDFSSHPTTAKAAAERGPERFKPPYMYIDNAKLGRLSKAIQARGGCGALRDCEKCKLCDQMLPELLLEGSRTTRGQVSNGALSERIAHAEALEGLIGELTEGTLTADTTGAEAEIRIPAGAR